MGIKDWFGGDKKKAAYRDKVKEAVGDGESFIAWSSGTRAAGEAYLVCPVDGILAW